MSYLILKADIDRECRIRGIRKHELARQLGVSPNTLSKFFCGIRETAPMARRLEAWLSANTDQ